MLMPIDAIRHTRSKTLASILDAVYSLINKMVDGNHCRAKGT